MKYIYKELSKKDQTILRGVINTPDDFVKDKKYPTAIFYHGFGGDRNGNTFFRTTNARYLTDRGYVVVRFDFSGTNESDGSFYDMTVSREEEEALLIYNFVKIQSFVDKERIYLMGHSLGGVIASLVAHKVKPYKICLLAPASDMNNKDYLKVMFESIYKDKIQSEANEDVKDLSFDDLVKDVEDMDIGGLRLNKKFLEDFLKKDIYKEASKYDGEVLIIRGDRDELVFRDSNVKLTESYPNAKYVEISDTNHDFTDENIRQEVFKIMYEFFEE
ncbi:MAG: alpha/beta fold hydrolase [Anaerococcus sp.]|nr:alpha/beta fold hydrolase [Anaerococcus sp.]